MSLLIKSNYIKFGVILILHISGIDEDEIIFSESIYVRSIHCRNGSEYLLNLESLTCKVHVCLAISLGGCIPSVEVAVCVYVRRVLRYTVSVLCRFVGSRL